MAQNKAFHKKKVRTSDPQVLIKGILDGDRLSLSRSITLCESTKEEDREIANEVLKACLPKSGHSIRIGISGVPGVGKSTFIESFGSYLTESLNKKIAVLAVDPSSEKSKGSILGDKTRMEKLSRSENAFIRPTASAGHLGGVAQNTRESIILCEAAGFEIILIETVGVGQSETEVRHISDFFLLLMLAGAGDELQGIKRGIMEMADGMVINKADGDNIEAAKKAKRNYQNAFHLFPPTDTGWSSQVQVCSSLYSENMDGVWKMIQEHEKMLQSNGSWTNQRAEQNRHWFRSDLRSIIENRLMKGEKSRALFNQLEEKVIQGELMAFEAAEQMYQQLLAQ